MLGSTLLIPKAILNKRYDDMGMFGERSRVVVRGGKPVEEPQEVTQPLVMEQMEEVQQDLGQIAREDAQKMAAIQEAMGVTQSLRNPQEVMENLRKILGPQVFRTPPTIQQPSVTPEALPSTQPVQEPSVPTEAPAPVQGVQVTQERPLVLPSEEVPLEKVEDAAPTREALISSVFKAEGGYSEDKADSGNYIDGKFIGTNHGISAPILAEYLGREPTVDEMKNLTKDKAREIAATRYYDRFKINSLPNNLQEIVLHAVFMGETRGVRAIQNLLGLTPDGILGPDTEAAMQKADFTKEDFKDEFLRELEFGTSKTNPKTNEPYSKPSPTWNVHGKGWTNRYTELAQ